MPSSSFSWEVTAGAHILSQQQNTTMGLCSLSEYATAKLRLPPAGTPAPDVENARAAPLAQLDELPTLTLDGEGFC